MAIRTDNVQARPDGRKRLCVREEKGSQGSESPSDVLPRHVVVPKARSGRGKSRADKARPAIRIQLRDPKDRKALARNRRGRFSRPDTPVSNAGEDRSGCDSDMSCSSLSLSSCAGPSRATDGDTGDERPDPSPASAAARDGGSLPGPEVLQAKMQARPMDELGACIASNLAAIQKVTDSSRKMKGSLVSDLREATRNTQAAVAELLRRQSKGADRLELLTAQFNAFQAKQGLVPSAPSSDVTTPKRATPAATTAARAPVASRKRAPAAQAGRAPAGAATTSRASVAPRAPAQLTSSEAGLMEHIGALIEEKLAAFRAEHFPDRAYRPALTGRAANRHSASEGPIDGASFAQEAEKQGEEEEGGTGSSAGHRLITGARLLSLLLSSDGFCRVLGDGRGQESATWIAAEDVFPACGNKACG
ncbi:uncharacterized protein LOC124539221 [Vanessa cardui]|uniref:uncharacterized protein LOC124539221 n=1 Tax=Vanessa cardui TaxID=171605 RepID=UPI001F13590F|nr:uncharacterized protein LOC124539221 [Vanessa cardui]